MGSEHLTLQTKLESLDSQLTLLATTFDLMNRLSYEKLSAFVKSSAPPSNAKSSTPEVLAKLASAFGLDKSEPKVAVAWMTPKDLAIAR